MKRLCAVLSLVLLVVLLVFAVPAVARADEPSRTPDGWTWDEL